MDDAPAAAGFGRLEIGVFYYADERKAGIVDVEPISLRQTVIELEHDADICQVLSFAEPVRIRGWNVRAHEIRDDGQRGRRDYGVGFSHFIVGFHTGDAIALDQQSAGRRSGSNLSAFGGDFAAIRRPSAANPPR